MRVYASLRRTPVLICPVYSSEIYDFCTRRLGTFFLLYLLLLYSCTCLFFFFFFQAEDGIRDVAVTGVQTGALPISRELYLTPCDVPLACFLGEANIFPATIVDGVAHTALGAVRVRVPARDREDGVVVIRPEEDRKSVV